MNLHILSPTNFGLFHRAIIVSAPVMMLSTPHENDGKVTEMTKLLGLLDMTACISVHRLSIVLIVFYFQTGCPLTSSPDVVQCLRSRPSDELIRASIKVPLTDGRPVWAPVMDGDLIPYTANKLDGFNFHKVNRSSDTYLV